jgi:hypothetical protein
VLLHELVHQHGIMLHDLGLFESKTGYDEGEREQPYADDASCSFPERVKNTFLWAMTQRFPRGHLFDDESSGESSCADDIMVGFRFRAWLPLNQAYNYRSDGLYYFFAEDCLRDDFGWSIPEGLEFPCQIDPPDEE